MTRPTHHSPIEPEVIRIRPDQVERIPPEQDPYYGRAFAPPGPVIVLSFWQQLRQRLAQAIGGPLVAPNLMPPPGATPWGPPRGSAPVPGPSMAVPLSGAPDPASPPGPPPAGGSGGGTVRYFVAAAGIGAAVVGIATVAAAVIHRVGYQRGIESAHRDRGRRRRSRGRRRQPRRASKSKRAS
ncbi:MAG: hypothetical protein Q8Q14_03420 [Gemmatimonadales bacterium]|nr:hypothetical protein [Gemmatimonadales bacterium]